MTVDAANPSLKAAQRMKGWGTEEVEVRMYIKGLARGQFDYFAFVHFVHMVLYGVAFGGFADPGLYADRG